VHVSLTLSIGVSFSLLIRRPPTSTLFPYTTSSDLHSAEYGNAGGAGAEPGAGNTGRVDERHSQGGGGPVVVRRDRYLYPRRHGRSEEHTSELQSRENLVCRLLLEKKKQEQ